MSVSVSTKYAVRSLLRQRRRTVLSVLGVAIACMSSLVTISYVRGEGELIIRAAAENGTGHVRIAPKGWTRRHDNDLRVEEWRAELERVRSMGGVKVATPRARADGLLAFGNRTAVAEIVGVDPATEQASNRLVREVAVGRYLQVEDTGSPLIETVLGKTIADRLDVELDDELVLTMSDADGEVRSFLLRIVGLVSTGSREIDETICQIALSDLERLTGRKGAGEIAILLKDHRRLVAFAEEIRVGLRGDNDILTWADVSPELRDGLAIDEGFTVLTVGIVVILAFLGITSSQLTAVLERRREFAVLSALGMKGRQMVRLVLLEGLLVGLAGAAMGLVLTLPPVYLLARYGIDLRWFAGEEGLAMSNVLLEPILYGDMGLWLVPYALAISLVATVVASIYPAWFAVNTDPASALRVA